MFILKFDGLYSAWHCSEWFLNKKEPKLKLFGSFTEEVTVGAADVWMSKMTARERRLSNEHIYYRWHERKLDSLFIFFAFLRVQSFKVGVGRFLQLLVD